MADDKIKVEGVITRINKGGMCNVEVTLQNGEKKDILCSLAGKLRKNKIHLVVGDRVEIGITPYDLSKGVISWRFK